MASTALCVPHSLGSGQGGSGRAVDHESLVRSLGCLLQGYLAQETAMRQPSRNGHVCSTAECLDSVCGVLYQRFAHPFLGAVPRQNPETSTLRIHTPQTLKLNRPRPGMLTKCFTNTRALPLTPKP